MTTKAESRRKKQAFMDMKVFSDLPINAAALKLGVNRATIIRWRNEKGCRQADRVSVAKHLYLTDKRIQGMTLEAAAVEIGVCTGTIVIWRRENHLSKPPKPTEIRQFDDAVCDIFTWLRGWGRPAGIDAHLEYLNDNQT